MTSNPVLPSPEDKPLMDLVPAGRVFGIGRTMSYQQAREGTFPVEVLRIAGRLKVRTADMRRYLGLDLR
jgi:hypothetical protein